MKKTFIIILTLVASLFLNSCSKADIMLSGDWWTIINDEVGSGQENLVIRFNSAKSTVNFALKSLTPKENTYYMIESLERKYTLESTGKGEGIIRIVEKEGTQWPELHYRSLTIATLMLLHIDENGKEADNIALFPFLEDKSKEKTIKTTTDKAYETRILNMIERFRAVGRLVVTK